VRFRGRLTRRSACPSENAPAPPSPNSTLLRVEDARLRKRRDRPWRARPRACPVPDERASAAYREPQRAEQPCGASADHHRAGAAFAVRPEGQGERVVFLRRIQQHGLVGRKGRESVFSVCGRRGRRPATGRNAHRVCRARPRFYARSAPRGSPPRHPQARGRQRRQGSSSCAASASVSLI
jgi:hypothetical protein